MFKMGTYYLISCITFQALLEFRGKNLSLVLPLIYKKQSIKKSSLKLHETGPCVISSGENHLSICHEKDPQEPLLTDHYSFLPDFKLMAICHKKSSLSHFYSAAS